ncbi:MAG: type I-E CRISPR-associated protein Cse2/CasB [Actinomycetota bacterium]|nr:type I-E CRISPR-associated protein Cse2/CasB [Actinomycetota bacterium]MDQ2958885.1 type I-E CRISPR-associated protein Cse2/CasB [Actinomycetota bacterium]
MTGPDAPAKQAPPLGELGELVHSRVTQLQAKQLARSASARATLAQLRRAVSKEPGSVPEVWEFTLSGVRIPPSYPDDKPAPTEYAAHIAMTLYAVHQQSRPVGMHQRGHRLGSAVRRLAKGMTDDIAVTRRFQALGTAQDLTEVTYHARGLISQLRAASIPLDYGLFADQLFLLQDPRRAGSVRLSWGREFHRTTRPDVLDTDESNGDTP